MAKRRSVGAGRRAGQFVQQRLCSRCCKLYVPRAKASDYCPDCTILTMIGMTEIGTKPVDGQPERR
jgi:hypothetical protein